MDDDQPRYDLSTRNFMVWIHIISIISMPFTRARFWLSFYSDTPILYYLVIFAFGISFSSYRHCTSNPGYVTPSDDPENPTNGDQVDKSDKYFYCKHCKQYVPIRASHCRTCQRCVIRRDHHCPYTGVCIGRDNHLVFLLWCYLETFLMRVVTYDTLVSLFHYKEFSMTSQIFYDHNISMVPLSKWQTFLSYMTIYKFNLGLLPFMLFDTYLIVLLDINHTLMAFNNITTWELKRRSSISYFQSYPLSKNPFNKGPLKNIIEFLKMKKEKLNWNHISPPDMNDFINEYNMFGVNIMSSLVSMFFY